MNRPLSSLAYTPRCVKKNKRRNYLYSTSAPGNTHPFRREGDCALSGGVAPGTHTELQRFVGSALIKAKKTTKKNEAVKSENLLSKPIFTSFRQDNFDRAVCGACVRGFQSFFTWYKLLQL